jgi:hypothetical protein
MQAGRAGGGGEEEGAGGGEEGKEEQAAWAERGRPCQSSSRHGGLCRVVVMVEGVCEWGQG